MKSCLQKYMAIIFSVVLRITLCNCFVSLSSKPSISFDMDVDVNVDVDVYHKKIHLASSSLLLRRKSNRGDIIRRFSSNKIDIDIDEQEQFQLSSSTVIDTATATATAAANTKTNTNTKTINNPADGISISTDEDYPYLFTGRLWFSPSIVKMPSIDSTLPSSINTISFLGYTIGGTVTLEYDTSPVGPYREYVTMSALVTKRAALGQWGSRLYVSTQEAEDVCQEVWGVPAEVANIDFQEETGNDNYDDDDDVLAVVKAPDGDAPTNQIQDIKVQGWSKTRVLTANEYNDQTKRWGNIPVLWTPTIKALWSPWVAGGVYEYEYEISSSSNQEEEDLPMHKLRLSASAIRLSWSGFGRKYDNRGFPLGIGLIVDNVLIEIGKRYGRL